jgi:hypothetical protein
MPSIENTLDRIDLVLKQNRKIEWTYILLTIVLFGCGIACIICALVSGKYLWSIPSAFTTGFLYWPLKEIKSIRQNNIALSTAPVLISTLPPDQAAREIQILIHTLYEENK